jgi:hypothetical protein
VTQCLTQACRAEGRLNRPTCYRRVQRGKISLQCHLLRLVPFAGHEPPIFFHGFDKLGFIQTKQNRIQLVDDLLHSLAHFVITDARKFCPFDFAKRTDDLYVLIIFGF